MAIASLLYAIWLTKGVARAPCFRRAEQTCIGHSNKCFMCLLLTDTYTNTGNPNVGIPLAGQHWSSPPSGFCSSLPCPS